ncbi:MFS transporter, DHA1 family, putative efflux transporter [Evansella caseinilytica]|uniref:MFS transporter, DHA1 family, putative efflux transporter n=1 Tax=Evansella caseinilytica TaxID=1503961 RepID=A0A1H3Q3Y9_9BACI|nr:MFS transporter [Evansella caseinilytica]SDZ08086.1 MFS transporter, DHA1 family, putative efflux transporter [Evansella caseinilytica]
MNRVTIYLLAFGAFVTGTAEFVVSGILEIIADDLDVSISLAGQLITMYSLSYALGALVLVMLTATFERKKVLLFSLAIFIAGNVIAFFSSTYLFLLVSRIVMAMSGGLYIVVATNYAAQLASPEKRGSAMATVITGFTVSLVLGVPVGTFVSAFIDWRYVYLFIALVTVVNLYFLYLRVPKMKGNPATPLRQQLLILKDRKLVSGLMTTIFWILGYTMVFAYIAPFLSEGAGFSIEKISTALFVLGVFAFIGSRFGGFAVDKWGPKRTIIISLLLHAAALFLLTFTIQSTVAVLITMMMWGVAAWTTTPAKQFYLISLKPGSSEIVLSFNTALMNVGMTIGAGLGGVIIQYTSILHISWISGFMVLLALGAILFSFQANEQRVKTEGKISC